MIRKVTSGEWRVTSGRNLWLRVILLLVTCHLSLIPAPTSADVRLFDKFSKLLDVQISSLTNGQVPRFNSVSGKWENADAPATPFLSANTARVDPSGNDATGTIGDLAKPFLTVQAAIDAFQAIDAVNGLIEIGSNNFSEDLVVDADHLSNLYFHGTDLETNSRAFQSLTFVNDLGKSQFYVGLLNCNYGSVTAAFDRLILLVQGGYNNGPITNTGGGLLISAETQFGEIAGQVTAAGDITLQGLSQIGNVISAPGFEIHLKNCRPFNADSEGVYIGIPTIDSAGSEVWATNSLISGVVTSGTLHLCDSRVVGTNNASSTVYTDVLLVPYVDASGFDGNLDTGDDTLQEVAQKVDDLSVSGGVTDVIGTAPIASSGGATPAISITAANTGAAGSMSSADKTKLDAISGTNTGDQLVFKTLAVSEQSDLVADTTTDTLTLAAGTGVTLTTNAGTDTVTIAASGGGGGAPDSATYITLRADGILSSEFAMDSLATGLVKNTTTTGVPSIAVAGTDYLAVSGTAAQTITRAPSANTVIAGLTLTDTTAATSGNQQYSPYIYQTGQGWKTNTTAASQSVTARHGLVPVQAGAAPTGNFVIDFDVNGGGFTNRFTLSSNGALTGLTTIQTTQVATLSEVNIGAGWWYLAQGAAGGVGFGSGHSISWKSATTATSNTGGDTGLARNAAGVVEINSGTIGTLRELKARSVIHSGVTIANLPGSPTAGQVAHITDGDAALAWGATAVNSGAGATKYLVWYNGTNWTVAGK